MQQKTLGALYSPAFFGAMLREGGRVEAEQHTALPFGDWILTYLNL